ncbi:hypothetical protein HAP94_08435 [Acidithiobacillus ferrivorans]|nr:hypothetical protein [Acidithiobacillus ferrivorans]
MNTNAKEWEMEQSRDAALEREHRDGVESPSFADRMEDMALDAQENRASYGDYRVEGANSDFQDFTKEDFEAMAKADAEHDALMNSVPEYDEAAARDTDDVRREAEHEKAVEKVEFKPWERPASGETQHEKAVDHNHER